MQFHFHANQSHFHKNGFALRLALKQRHKGTRKWPINPLTPGTFCKKGVFWAFWSFLGWILAKLPLIQSKMHLQHNSLPFLPPASHFSIVTRACAEINILRFLEFFFRLCFFSFPLLYAAAIDLLLGLLAVKKPLRKRHRDGQFSAWSSQV